MLGSEDKVNTRQMKEMDGECSMVYGILFLTENE